MGKDKKQDDTTDISLARMEKHASLAEEEKNRAKKKMKRVKATAVICVLAALFIGWFGGSCLPLPGSMQLRENIRSVLGFSSEDKIDEVKDIMENEWYFSKDIDDLDERMTDQAVAGMTANDEDPHTEYMSAEENAAFVQSINRDYVGIGAEFILYNGHAMVTRIIRNSPAEEAGLQAGDILLKADGTDLSDMTTTEIRNAIIGDKGTKVTITIQRGSETMDLTFTRDSVTDTVNAYMIDDDTVYLRLYQFGESTAEDVKDVLEDLVGDNEVNMVLDLRSNGGGYLNSVQALASFFIDEGDTVLTQEFRDGTKNTVKAEGGKMDNIHDIAILVNSGTASAAEVMTLALKQNRDDVTVIGNTTYGKGTVQTSVSFDDGSTLKYTTSRWLSPEGDWINDKGIEPDQTVDLPEALTISYPEMEEDDSYALDSVSDATEAAQLILQYLGYDTGREDGYFDAGTQSALKAFEKEYALKEDGVLSYEDYMRMISEVTYDWAVSTDHDTQLAAALEKLNG